MAEQLILKGTLEGHVSFLWQLHIICASRCCCCCCRAAAGITELELMAISAEWLGHQLGHVDGEVRIWPRPTQLRLQGHPLTMSTAPTCFSPAAETRPSSSGTSPAMRPSTATPSGRSTATPTSSLTAYVFPAELHPARQTQDRFC